MSSRRHFLRTATGGLTATWLSSRAEATEAMRKRPNLVYLLADDLGYGDVHALNPERGKIPTPNLDRLAAEGRAFTDTHSNSAVCTPTRYGVLTGRYAWRSRLQRGVLGSYDEPLIPTDRLTVPALLRRHGYHTACFGKWHLGLTWPVEGKQRRFDQPFRGGPLDLGFDEYFGVNIPNWGPFCFLEGDRCVESPSERMPKGNPYGDKAGEPMAPGWDAKAILPTITDKVCEHLDQRAQDDRPFFIYYALTSPHTPIAVNERWQGKSGLNAYADFVMETDAMVGRVVEAIDRNGLADNTLVIFTSDNGCAPYIGVHDLEAKGHYPSAQFRGYKADAWDGGHRIPFLARRPGMIEPGSTCDRLTCLTDLLATCADLLGDKLPENAGEDSVSILPLLTGVDRPVRETVVHHSIHGKFAIRDSRWKLLLCPGSGGWASPKDNEAAKQGLPSVQLYDMQSDPGETTNLQAEYPEVVARLRALLEKCVAEGRSTPGVERRNDVTVVLS